MANMNLLADRLQGKEIQIAEVLTRCENYDEALEAIEILVNSNKVSLRDVIMTLLKQNRAAVLEVEALAQIASKTGYLDPRHVYNHLSDLSDTDITHAKNSYVETNKLLEMLQTLLGG